jgi:tRNA A37 threonylcarbamoyladenosine dehydratase
LAASVPGRPKALARSAIGRITLIDLDMIAESNVNRQVHALDGEFGKAKVSAMAHGSGPSTRLPWSEKSRIS